MGVLLVIAGIIIGALASTIFYAALMGRIAERIHKIKALDNVDGLYKCLVCGLPVRELTRHRLNPEEQPCGCDVPARRQYHV